MYGTAVGDKQVQHKLIHSLGQCHVSKNITMEFGVEGVNLTRSSVVSGVSPLPQIMLIVNITLLSYLGQLIMWSP